ncbi:MAG: D-alanyl-D-alanine carboxypeptidase, partial [Actinomycetota bacterium]|nr:D-alanyl-D-alanine carboxypeptidase [Actinomycetota bacterium]
MSSQRSSPIVVLAAVILLPAMALFGVWRYADGKDGETGEPLPTTIPGAAAPPAPAPPLSTPLISFRRVPGLIARDLNDDAFIHQVTAFANTLDSTSCLVVRLDGVDVGSHNANVPVIPASNQKLLVAAAALHVLGVEYTFTTQAQAAGVSNGVVPGDLYLVGGGDPLLTTNDYPAENINGYAVLNATSLDSLA